ncbi:hypothetical protein OS493_007658 [Desmophyllum pertusum]|uniref:Uncharacterized protein n=1 Tax=Desmophyllum pertusum TaxID=174260 RepID=A0A9W9YUN1_9CNID|nr:hypothetical protein OS493_007658 [Desmophyllum pertusum]
MVALINEIQERGQTIIIIFYTAHGIKLGTFLQQVLIKMMSFFFTMNMYSSTEMQILDIGSMIRTVYRRLLENFQTVQNRERPRAEEIYYRIEDIATSIRLQWSDEENLHTGRSKKGKSRRSKIRNKCSIA